MGTFLGLVADNDVNVVDTWRAEQGRALQGMALN